MGYIPVGTSQVPDAVGLYYNRLALIRVVHDQKISKFIESEPMPKGHGLVVKFRRYLAMPRITTPTVEGVTGTPGTITISDFTATLEQYSNWVPITDVVKMTTSDPVLNKIVTLMAEQAAESLEAIRIGPLLAGTSVYFGAPADTVRGDVNDPVSGALFSKIQRFLENQKARKISRIIEPSQKVGTVAIAPAYVALCHSDLRYDLEKITGFIKAKDYASQTLIDPEEIGSYGALRFVPHSLFEPWPDAGAAKGTMKSTAGTYADVYPILVMGKQFAATVGLSSKEGLETFINPPGGQADPTHQRTSVAWKAMMTSLILNDYFGVRAEVGVTAEASFS